MSKPVEALMVEMETECKAVAVANTPRGVGGSCERSFAGVEFCVRTGGAGLIWTRDNKRVSRKTAAEQIRELIESLETDAKAVTAVPQLEELKEAKTKGANAYENGDSLICCNPFPEGSARANAWAYGWRAEQDKRYAKLCDMSKPKRYVVNAVKNAHVSGLWGVKDTLEPVGSRFRGLATFTREQDAHDFAAMLEAPRKAAAPVDHAELFRKYLEHVRQCEGIDFTDRLNDHTGSDVAFSDAEVAEILRLASSSEAAE